MSAIRPANVVVAMSGGVDSAVAASLLLDQGHSVQGLFMSNWEEDEGGYCTSAEDYQDARRVADQLGIALHRSNFAREYRERVFAHFLDEYRAGRTPNPDVLCNREIKFGACFAYAKRLGAELFATGHYARVGPLPEQKDGPKDGEYALLRAADASKDQTYFLHAIDPGLLPQIVFPLGAIQKSEVRAIARARSLPVHDKKDSTGICFIGERPFADFLSQHLAAARGPIESVEGVELGTHVGLIYYTLGQRQGIRVGGRRGADAAPWYVVDKDLARNVLVVAQGQNHHRLMSSALETARMHWLTQQPILDGDLTAQIRHRQRPFGVRCKLRADGSMRVEFQEPQRAIAPGQFVVLYQSQRCLGGAVIERTIACSATAPLAERLA
jgi:tRNA-specific 2-thiouridylase